VIKQSQSAESSSLTAIERAQNTTPGYSRRVFVFKKSAVAETNVIFSSANRANEKSFFSFGRKKKRRREHNAQRPL